jgi:serine/threonine-protein kinase
MGAVYKATDLETGSPKAMKFLRLDYAGNDPKSYERFRREGLATSLIDHPNVVKVQDYGRLVYGEAYILMEYVEGPTLRQYMRRKRIIPISTVIMIAWQATSGLEAAHQRIVLHRDLKPENIMLTRDEGDNLLVKVIDFGLAKLKPSIEVISQDALTPLGVFLGTIQYSSPESCKGLQLDARSDIYSLGVILYEMLAGKRPFLGTTLLTICQQHIEAAPTPISSLRPNIPYDLANLIMQSLSKDPASRPQTVKEFGDRLRHVARSIHPSPFPAGHSILEPYAHIPHEQRALIGVAGKHMLPLPDQLGEIIVGPPRPATLDPVVVRQRPQRSPALLFSQGRMSTAAVISLGAGAVLILVSLIFFFFIWTR